MRYVKPTLEVIVLETEDVIRTSGEDGLDYGFEGSGGTTPDWRG